MQTTAPVRTTEPVSAEDESPADEAPAEDANERATEVPDEQEFPASRANRHWIGGACKSAEDCGYEGAVCLTDGFPNGMCSLGCDSVCPDRRRSDFTMTACVEGRPLGLDGGACVSRCDIDLLGGDGCAAGYSCEERHRFGDISNVASVCTPIRVNRCAPDEFVDLDYPDKGSIWIPAEAQCHGPFDVIVLLHGTNRLDNPTPQLHGGLRLELLARSLIDAGQLRPVVLAEPVHFESRSNELFGAGFQLTTYLSRLREQLERRGISIGSLSFVGHSGAGCHENNGMYKVLDELGTIVPEYAPSLKLWGLADVCYEAPYHWQRPMDVLEGTHARVLNLYVTQGDPSGFEDGLFPEARPFACDAGLYHHCLRSAKQPWCSMRAIDITHENAPYYFMRDMLPQVFPGPRGAATPACWRQ